MSGCDVIKLLLDFPAGTPFPGDSTQPRIGQYTERQRESGYHLGVEPSEAAGRRYRPDSSECPEPSGVEPGSKSFAFHPATHRGHIAAIERDIGTIARLTEGRSHETSSQVGPYDPVMSDGRSGAKYRPGYPSFKVPSGSKLGVTSLEIRSGFGWKLTTRVSCIVVGPEQSAPTAPAERAEVATSYGPTQYFILEMNRRIEKDPVGSGLETEVAAHIGAQRRLLLQLGNGILDSVANQNPWPTPAQSVLKDMRRSVR
jgi:hypothetical protein